MAFNIDVSLNNVEFRAIRTGKSRNGGQWVQLVVEIPKDSRQCEITVPQEMQGEIFQLGLHKGDFVSIDCAAIANSDYQMLRLTNIVTVDGEYA